MYSVIISCLLSYIIGLVGWNTGINGFGILALLPGLWLNAGSRLSCFFVILCYYIGATHELFYGAEAYFTDSAVMSSILWACQQLVLASGWVIFWKKGLDSFWEILYRLSLTFVMTIFIPPYSFLGIANPVTAAGYFFPKTGMAGIFLFICLSGFCGYLFIKIKNQLFGTLSRRALARIAFAIFLFNSIFIIASEIYARTTTEELNEKKKGRIVVKTELGNIEFGTIFYKDYERHLKLKKIAELYISVGYQVVIFPEMVAGKWTDVEEDMWRDVDAFAKANNSAVLIGAQRVISGRQYDNALVVLGDQRLISKNLIKSRISMPFSNWNPFSQWSATLNISPENNGVLVINKEPAAVLICYEQMLVWPILQSMTNSQKPELIITVSNLWWAKKTYIPKIMENTTSMWGRLFNVPVLRAVNT
jgi:hypothetical protein